MQGYDELQQSKAYFPLQRGLILIKGEDRARLIHAMCTNHVQQLEPGQGCYAFFLNAQGRILADAHIFNLGEELLLDTEGSAREKLYQHIDNYIIADDVTLEDVSDQYPVIAIEGTGVGARTPYAINDYVASLSRTGLPGERHYHGASTDGLTEASAEAVETARLENGVPIYGIDFTEANIAQETGIAHAMHFSKGCYLGQEIVERVRSQGRLNRSLQYLHIEGSTAPESGASLLYGEKEAGKITSAAYSPRLGKVVAFGFVRREAETQPLTVNGATASVQPRPAAPALAAGF